MGVGTRLYTGLHTVGVIGMKVVTGREILWGWCINQRGILLGWCMNPRGILWEWCRNHRGGVRVEAGRTVQVK